MNIKKKIDSLSQLNRVEYKLDHLNSGLSYVSLSILGYGLSIFSFLFAILFTILGIYLDSISSIKIAISIVKFSVSWYITIVVINIALSIYGKNRINNKYYN